MKAMTKRIAVAALLMASALMASALDAPQAVAQGAEMYQSSVPMDKDVLKEQPDVFHIDFGEAIHVREIKIVDANNTDWPLDWKFTDDDVHEVKFRSLKRLPPGDYQLEWSAYVRQHWHPDAGAIRFRIEDSCCFSQTVDPSGAIGKSLKRGLFGRP